jgi:hypothetical protein
MSSCRCTVPIEVYSRAVTRLNRRLRRDGVRWFIRCAGRMLGDRALLGEIEVTLRSRVCAAPVAVST